MPNFAFLLLKEHPYGREMLEQLTSSGFLPKVIISEDSDVGDEEREKFLKRIEGRPVASTIAKQVEKLASNGFKIAHFTVEKHDSESIMPIIEHLDLDLIVFGGTRIIRGDVLDFPRDGVLNSHPGLLPECRGSASPAWSVYHDIPIGSSTHFCDNGIDTGDLLLKRQIGVMRGMTYEDLCYHTLVLSGTLMRERWRRIQRMSGVRCGDLKAIVTIQRSAMPLMRFCRSSERNSRTKLICIMSIR